MKALQLQVKKHWGGETIPQMSPKGQSASNGVAEKAIQEIEAQVGTMLMALERRLDFRLELDMAVTFWLIEYAAEPINRHKVQRHDGKMIFSR